QALISDLGHPNLTVRMLAMNELVSRVNNEVIAPLGPVCLKDGSSERRAHVLWILERRGALSPGLLRAAAAAALPVVRPHVMGILRERAEWAALERSLVAAGLKDNNAFVQRAAVEAVASHPDPELLAPLFKLRREAPDSDLQLRYASRVALRDAFM